MFVFLDIPISSNFMAKIKVNNATGIQTLAGCHVSKFSISHREKQNNLAISANGWETESFFGSIPNKL